MKLLQATNKAGQLILNDFVNGEEIDRRIFWLGHSPYYLSKGDNFLIPFKAIHVTNVYQQEQEE